MLLDTYKANELIWITTINGKTKNGLNAFRGDLIVKLGEFNEVANKRNPPEAAIKEAVILADDTSLLMVVGNFSDILELPQFISHFTADLAADCKPILFIDNLKESVVVDVDGRPYTLISLPAGMIWSQCVEIAVYLRIPAAFFTIPHLPASLRERRIGRRQRHRGRAIQ
ncbi:MAG: hypothetical protein BWK73_17635 [Thiothrix lacustris]|uniref:Uncharacterized protein n=1 Tax=Thiothrix lacustris TaxID=525917 RepID=A0A1Y1QQG3_9GAMM|nr:MAG: hypothetical protein BWK73_17635 [Thiothrix lacustris]